LGLLLAGCAMQPDGETTRRPAPAERTQAPLAPAPLALAPRVGIEYLPPHGAGRVAAEHLTPVAPSAAVLLHRVAISSDLVAAVGSGQFADLAFAAHGQRAATQVEVAAVSEDPRRPAAEARAAERPVPPWERSEAEIAAIEDPLERFTLSFLHNIVSKERRRIQRELGATVLFTRLRTVSTDHRLETILDARDREDQETLFRRYGISLLKKPLQRTLRQSTFIQDLELVLESVKAEAFPLSEAYQESHGDRWKLGRISVRLHPSDASDPVEVVYIRSGWRIGTSEEQLKVAYTMEISPDLSFAIRGQYGYRTDYLDMWGNLRYDVNPDTRLHLLVGTNLDLLTGTTMFPLVQSPVVLPAADESTGLLVYVEHFF
jgi:hypothetical protein